jgi:uncharacterized membrane protein
VEFVDVIERLGRVMESGGVAIIVVGAAMATILFLYQMRQGGSVDAAYVRYRRGLGRAILLGLEFLVAGDIIRTVAISPTFTSVGILAIIVAIRTFLSSELQLEIEGRWPWQRRGVISPEASPQETLSATRVETRIDDGVR